MCVVERARAAASMGWLVCGMVAGAGLSLVGCTESIELEDSGPAIEFDAGPPGMVEPDAGPPPVGSDAGLPECVGDDRMRRQIYFGTSTPTAIPLAPGQVLAVVSFDTCSGAYISDEWILTARHCGITPGRQACVGEDPSNPNVCLQVDRVETHPTVDIALAHVSVPVTRRLPALVPIPINTEPLNNSWIGRTMEAAGYGRQEDGSSGEREFAAEPIVALENELITVDGMGTRGVCSGDSGGPLLGLASDSTVRVFAELFGGDSSCVGRDNFTRTDLFVEWIEAITGPTVVEGAPCGGITPVGDCLGGSTAAWCDSATGLVTSETCAAGRTCGWSESDGGYRCVTDDPCLGVTAAGVCDGGEAVWCDAGTIRRRDCGACGQICRYVTDVGGFFCLPDPCLGFDPIGECDGTVLTLCDPDQGFQSIDCAMFGRTCGFSTRRGRNSCVR